MTTNKTPVATSVAKPNNAGGVTKVLVAGKRKVTYVFNATSSKGLKIPYAVAVNGKTLPEFATRPGRVSGDGDRIVTVVDAGARVALFLNSDAHPSYRTAPVYEVTAGERDVVVRITEKSGKHADSDTPVRKASSTTDAAGTGDKAASPPEADEYTAPLTGDIWMKVSHKYAASEVEALLPKNTSAAVTAAVKSIYDGLAEAKLQIVEPGPNGKRLDVTFADSDNPKNNITSYTLLKDGLPRVHPAGFAAAFNAALESGVESIQLSSCWRPMLGKIAHRAGLGLDVSYLGKIKLDRQELRTSLSAGKTTGNGKDDDNVSDAEVKLFREFEEATKEKAKADAALKAARAAAENPKLSPEDKAKAVQAEKEAAAAQEKSATAQIKAEKAWTNERDKNEPAKVKLYRTSLLKCSCVKQLFDPWFMYVDAKGKAEPNMQRGPTPTSTHERLHAHHLHVTVDEPKILPT